MRLMGGGDVVGNIPSGLPAFRPPALGLDAIMSLLSAVLIIALVAFMESISMVKTMATKSKQKINPNLELIGQGLSNLGGAFFQAYPACGSFTGSVINLRRSATPAASYRDHGRNTPARLSVAPHLVPAIASISSHVDHH